MNHHCRCSQTTLIEIVATTLCLKHPREMPHSVVTSSGEREHLYLSISDQAVALLQFHHQGRDLHVPQGSETSY